MVPVRCKTCSQSMSYIADPMVAPFASAPNGLWLVVVCDLSTTSQMLSADTIVNHLQVRCHDRAVFALMPVQYQHDSLRSKVAARIEHVPLTRLNSVSETREYEELTMHDESKITSCDSHVSVIRFSSRSLYIFRARFFSRSP